MIYKFIGVPSLLYGKCLISLKYPSPFLHKQTLCYAALNRFHFAMALILPWLCSWLWPTCKKVKYKRVLLSPSHMSYKQKIHTVHMLCIVMAVFRGFHEQRQLISHFWWPYLEFPMGYMEKMRENRVFGAICRISVYGRKLEDFPKGNGTIPIKILSPGSILVEKIFTSQQKIFNQNKHGAFEQKKNQQHALLLFLKWIHHTTSLFISRCL